jgi:platelet-activating factor acetylhydrolase
MLPSLNPLPSFPAYTGPYKVGSTEIEIPTSEITSESPVPDPKITSIKFRVFYPTTSDATSKKSVSWLPEPHKESLAGLISFSGASARLQKILSLFPNILSHVDIPAVRDAPLLSQSSKQPVLIFSHGLGGNANAYSSICGNLASCGIVAFAPEHRDGSCPVAYAKTKRSSSVSSAYKVPYQKHAHRPDPEVLDARNKQLRIRLWELELLYSAINALNDGKHFNTYSSSNPPSFKSTLDLSPGKVTWAGHSFGSATVVQFVKSIFYHESLPTPPEADTDDWTPLYRPSSNHTLLSQITPQSPLILLDLWTMPLRGYLTEWLWERPLPCYSDPDNPTSNVLAIMSTEFTNYTELLTRMKALLSAEPVATLAKLESQSETRSESESQSHSTGQSQSQEQFQNQLPTPDTSSTTSSSAMTLTNKSNEPLLFTTPHSAHLSQSDFGPLFPYLNRRFLKVDDPHAKIQINTRAILQAMRMCGVEVGSVRGEKLEEAKGWDEQVLGGEVGGLRRLALDV